MTPPRCVDADGQLCPTRPCPTCGRVIPVNRWPVKTLATTTRWPYQVMTFVEWCGHQQEVVLVPDGDDCARRSRCWEWRGERFIWERRLRGDDVAFRSASRPSTFRMTNGNTARLDVKPVASAFAA